MKKKYTYIYHSIQFVYPSTYLLPTVTRKWFESADCDPICTIYLSLCTQTADPKPFRGTHCSCTVHPYFLKKVCLSIPLKNMKLMFNNNIFSVVYGFHVRPKVYTSDKHLFKPINGYYMIYIHIYRSVSLRGKSL